jgi:hypothetical protein
MNLGMSREWHIKHTNLLKSMDAKYRAMYGANPSLPLWGNKPRSGARWSEEEEADLLARLGSMPRGPLGTWELCELGWHHGRSSAGIELHLKKLLGPRAFFSHFPITN